MRKSYVVSLAAVLPVGLLWLACGQKQPLSPGGEGISAGSGRAGKPAVAEVALGKNQAVIVATVTQAGAPVAGLEVAFSRSVSGLMPDYAWKATTGSDGVARVTITVDVWKNVSGYYMAKATNAGGQVMGEWGSIPVKSAREQVLWLPIGRKASISEQYLARDIMDVHDSINESLNTHNLQRLMGLVTDNIVWTYLPLGKPANGSQEVAGLFGGLLSAFPDFHVTQRQVLYSGNIMATECVTRATHTGGPWYGVPATGRHGSGTHMDIAEFEGMKVKQLITYDDGVGELVFLGAMPAPQPPPLKPSFILPAPEATRLPSLQAQTEIGVRYNAHDLTGYAKMIRPDADIYIEPLGSNVTRDQFIALQELYFLGFADLQYTTTRMLDMGGGWVVCEALFKGTNRGPYFGIPATGRPVEVKVAWISRFNADGLLTYFHCYYDELGTLTQLGLLPK